MDNKQKFAIFSLIILLCLFIVSFTATEVSVLEDKIADQKILIDKLKAKNQYLRAAIEIRNQKISELEKHNYLNKETDYTARIMEVTKYAPLDDTAIAGWDYCGDPNITASGDPVIPGETVAAGPSIPFGTEVYIEGFGWRTVNDRGGLIDDHNIDIATNTKEQAQKFGRQKRLVIIKDSN